MVTLLLLPNLVSEIDNKVYSAEYMAEPSFPTNLLTVAITELFKPALVASIASVHSTHPA